MAACFYRKAEHCYLSDKAKEERNKRADYRPIIEYDWVHRQRSHHQVLLIWFI